ncbi:dynamin family protein [Alkalihalobacterium sp. APHAB7]|uniref:dynamin family protein n=1 Tax=Alkalihalobacterium sp. APHAB7 TaxID=3402081 RepID=UPI003AAE2771
MNYTEEKQKILSNVQTLLEKVAEILPNSSQFRVLLELEEDIIEDYYSIVVVGEFKHGKSTFVNALLGRDIMPRDVTPTTATINAVFYSEQEEVQILKSNGELERRELTLDTLNEYTAAADFNPNDINYLKLFLPAELLQNRVVLIDTPGVNDLNDHRSQITYQFIPRADVILFMTSMTDAFKNTEKEFIQNQLQKNGLDKTLFIANFLDRIDDEEFDDVMEFMSRRLEKITGNSTSPLYALSSKEALEGKLHADEELLNYSGLLEIERDILAQIEGGSRSKEKLSRFETRLALLSEVILQEIETSEGLSKQSIEELEQQQKVVKEWFDNKAQLETELQHYLTEREEEIKFMVRKSVNYFGDRLREDVENRIHTYHGPDIKSLVETQLPFAIKSQLTQWIDQYSDHINNLFHKLQQEVSRGLAESFEQSVRIQAYQSENIQYSNPMLSFETKSGNANVKAGLAMGGASTVALLLGASFFIPIVGMAGLPFLSQKIAEKQLENLKPELISTVQLKTNELIDQFQLQLDQYIRDQMFTIKEQSVDEFHRLLSSYYRMVQDEIRKKTEETSQINEYRAKLEGCKEWIERMSNQKEVVL